MNELIVNRVAESLLTTIDLEEFYPKNEIALFDLKPFLFKELILRENDFRDALKSYDWQNYKGKVALVTCSADAIVPMWAYMLVATYLQPIARDVSFGTESDYKAKLLLKNIQDIDVNAFSEKRVVIKGCGNLPIGEAAYLEITKILRPVVKSIMYGEPCSTVPIYKRKQNQ